MLIHGRTRAIISVVGNTCACPSLHHVWPASPVSIHVAIKSIKSTKAFVIPRFRSMHSFLGPLTPQTDRRSLGVLWNTQFRPQRSTCTSSSTLWMRLNQQSVTKSIGLFLNRYQSIYNVHGILIKRHRGKTLGWLIQYLGQLFLGPMTPYMFYQRDWLLLSMLSKGHNYPRAAMFYLNVTLMVITGISVRMLIILQNIILRIKLTTNWYCYL